MDLTLVALPAREQPRWRRGRFGLVPCSAPYGERFPDNTVDMGTGYDCFDTLAHTLDPRIQGDQRENRLRLKTAMEAAGFVNYENEWWHYTLAASPTPTPTSTSRCRAARCAERQAPRYQSAKARRSV